MESSTKYHQILAQYFFGKPLDSRVLNIPSINTRKLAEQPWQIIKGSFRNSSLLLNTLNNYDYIEAKITAKMEYSLLEDFLMAPSDYDQLVYNYNFLLCNLSNLKKYPQQLLNLLYFQGTDEIKLQVRETFQKRERYQILIETEEKSGIKAKMSTHEDSYTFHIKHKKKLASSQLCITKSKKLIFCIMRSGSITAVNPINGIEYPVLIKISKETPEKIHISESGDYIIFAYQNQIALIYKLIYKKLESGLLIIGDEVMQIEFLLPEFDPPIFRFFDTFLIYQKPSYELVKMNLLDSESSIFVSGKEITNKSELAFITSRNDYQAVGLRKEDNTQIILLDNNTILGQHRINSIVQCAEIFKKRDLVVCTLDKKLYHLELVNSKLVEKRIFKLKEAPFCSTSNHSRIILSLLSNHLYVYEGNEDLWPITDLAQNTGSICELESFDDDTFIRASHSHSIHFYITEQDSYNSYETISLLQRRDGAQFALMQDENQKWFFDLQNDTIKTFAPSKGMYINRYLIASDGKNNILHLFLEGFGEYYDYIGNNWSDLIDVPTNFSSTIGERDGGFWAADKSGGIFHLRDNKRFEQVFRINEEIKGIGALKIFNDILVWNGVVLISDESGTNFKNQIRFFRITSANHYKDIEPIGERVFINHNSPVDSICYDQTNQKFYIFLFSDKKKFQKVRVGSVSDFLTIKEEIIAIKGLDQSIRFCAQICNDNLYYTLGNRGALFLLDLKDYKVKSVLYPNNGINLIVQDSIINEPLLFSLYPSKLYCCNSIVNNNSQPI